MISEARIDSSLVENARLYLDRIAKHQTPAPEMVEPWERFYAICDSAIRKFAATHGVLPHEVDDCAQDVWVDLIRRLTTFEYDSTRGRFESWLYAVVHSTAIDGFRRRRRQKMSSIDAETAQEPIDRQSDPAMAMDRSESRHRTRVMLKTIRENVPRENYLLLRMRWLQGKSVDYVANIMGISSARVWFREHRARKKLRSVFESQPESDRPAQARPQRARSKTNAVQ